MRVMAEGKRLTKYVDLPLQHADDAMLKAMRRPGSFDSNLKLLSQFRQRIPGLSIRSSFIVGYPGETEAQFKRLLEFLDEAQLDRAGFFTYSQEELTPSGSLLGQIPDKVKRERQGLAAERQAAVSRRRLKQKLGSTLEVLVERLPGQAGNAVSLDGYEHESIQRKAGTDKSNYVGRSQGDAPDIDGKVHFKSSKPLNPGDFVQVRVESSDEHDLFGSLV
jgi:ribosomal protein S12 methylthiotransferase